ncbi:hydroxypyruvate isomerase family protein [Planctomonas psychrotolerans]|uniref:hydroxypyruvate isomerase family protein n=1 Tax=Planctomonas psychrotolerans TaxID=2528712 RepID=UPI00123991D2|nr:TIM barrel protein [Planctomonas psychrotolerans]
MTFSANVSILYSELPFLDRFAAARAAGFTDVECWWPFASPTPEDGELRDFYATLESAEVNLRGLNFFAGNMAAGDRGVLSSPAAAEDFASNIAALRAIAVETGCRTFNALYGHRQDGLSDEMQRSAASSALRRAADALGDLEPTILLEPLTLGENGDYPLVTIDDVLRVLDITGESSVRLLFDAYHLHNNGADIVADVVRHADRIGHIQIADSPGRGAPGTGDIDFAAFLAAVESTGYDGFIGCEYREPVPQVMPTIPTRG